MEEEVFSRKCAKTPHKPHNHFKCYTIQVAIFENYLAMYDSDVSNYATILIDNNFNKMIKKKKKSFIIMTIFDFHWGGGGGGDLHLFLSGLLQWSRSTIAWGRWIFL